MESDNIVGGGWSFLFAAERVKMYYFHQFIIVSSLLRLHVNSGGVDSKQ